MKQFFLVGLFCLCAAVTSVAQSSDNGWYVGTGFTLTPRVAEVAADYSPARQFTHSKVVFPQVFAGYRFEHAALEAGYRKLGVLNFVTADGATKGATHSNALTFSTLLPFAHVGQRVEFYGKGSLNLIRTITEIERRAAGFPIQGEQNVWQVSPSFGLGAAFKAQDKWTLRAEGEVIVGKLGEATRSGRYQQAVMGLSVARHF